MLGQGSANADDDHEPTIPKGGESTGHKNVVQGGRKGKNTVSEDFGKLFTWGLGKIYKRFYWVQEFMFSFTNLIL